MMINDVQKTEPSKGNESMISLQFHFIHNDGGNIGY